MDHAEVETVGGSRCPCGHLSDCHDKPTGEIPGEVTGACWDCDCKGLVEFEVSVEEGVP